MKHKKQIIRLIAFLALACLVIGFLPLAVWADEDTTAEEFQIPQDAIYLSTPEDLRKLAENCVSDSWSRDKVVVLTCDVDMTGMDFAAIPTFGGIFLGQGHTIRGIELTAEYSDYGFFRYLQAGAVVKDLHLEGRVQPEGNDNVNVGGLVGVNSGILRNCSFTGTVSGNRQVGGLVGLNGGSGILEGCTVSGLVHGNHYIGGLAGRNQGVIRTCANRAEVNPQADHNSVAADNLLGLDVENPSANESIKDATNLGGIAGISSGVIRDCENHGSIGSEKMGYNVGGIAGSQIGYITGCANYGTINGSNGVGGIVGQCKPNVVLAFGENPLDVLMADMSGLMGSMTGMMNSVSGTMGSISAEKENIEQSMDRLKDGENLDADTRNAILNDMSNSFNNMYNAMGSMGSDMTGQMEGMMGSVGAMANTMESLSQGFNITIYDVSREDTPDNTLAKVENCTNYGPVLGEVGVGGIAGVADVEDTTAAEEVEGQLTFSNEGEVVMRLVIRDCRNLAAISGADSYAGGIVGNMVIGAVLECTNIGGIDGWNADYVGGIAGRCDSYLAGCDSRCVLAGSRYVGGVAGYAVEVADCWAITEIAAGEKYVGGVLGDTEPLPGGENTRIQGNRYYLAGENVGGIDGICYEGATAPVTVKEILAREKENELLTTVTIRLRVQGREDVVMNVPLGSTIALADIPQLETEAHEQYQWQLVREVTTGADRDTYLNQDMLTKVLFDRTYVAVFDGKDTVVGSENLTAAGRPLALAVGGFNQGVTLKLTDMTLQQPTVNGVTVWETWNVTMSEGGVEKLHYHIPADVAAEDITLYVKGADGSWAVREFTVEGSYIIFSFTERDSAFALAVREGGSFSILAVAAIAAVAVLGGLLVYRKRKKTKA